MFGNNRDTVYKRLHTINLWQINNQAILPECIEIRILIRSDCLDDVEISNDHRMRGIRIYCRATPINCQVVLVLPAISIYELRPGN